MPPKKNSNYSEENLLKAVAEIRCNKLSTRAASKKYNIPQSTLADRVSGRYAPTKLKSGR